MTERIAFARQLRLLMEIKGTTSSRTVTEVAEAVGISAQTLFNLLHGRSDNPRLETLRSLCRYYDISLDYFDCSDEAACFAYLADHHLKSASPLIQQIQAQTRELSPKGWRNILAALEWMRLASQAPGA